MTTPDERTRALNETRLFLAEVSLGASAPGGQRHWPHWQRAAGRLLRHFPGPVEVSWIERSLYVCNSAPTAPRSFKGDNYWRDVRHVAFALVGAMCCATGVVALLVWAVLVRPHSH